MKITLIWRRKYLILKLFLDYNFSWYNSIMKLPKTEIKENIVSTRLYKPFYY